MIDYEPFDLSAWCNVDTDWVDKVRNPPVLDWPPEAEEYPRGACEFHGLPFQIVGDDASVRFMGFGPGGHGGPVRIQIGRTVRWVIIAHRLLETHLHEGAPVGRVVADYRFRFANGEEVTVPIRERFEISVVPTQWGQWPLLAVADQADRLLPRYEGNWESIGFRLMDVEMVWPNWFVLWPWQNPHPEMELETLIVEPKELPFFIAAITLSNLDEDPFGRDARQPVLITLRNQEDANEHFDLAVDLDRGVATYPYPLPVESKEDFLADAQRGWGQPYNHRNDRAYSEIEARPSATLHLRCGEQQKLVARWGDILERGAVETDQARIELVDRGKNWVHVKVLDEDSGQPVPCRVHFRSPEGIPYQPHGHHDHLLSDNPTWNIDVGGDVRLGHVTYAYIDGTCQGWLPRGEVIVDIAKGFEYEPLRTTVNIASDQRELQLRLKRKINMADRRWFSGDTHVHFLSTMGALLEGQCEDLNVVNLLQSQWGHLFTNTEEFVGRPITNSGGDTIVYTSQENRQHILGHLSLLGLKQPVMPWCTGGSDEAELSGTLETTLSHWADGCHDQGGTVIIPHFPHPNCEIAALIATGRADALEMGWHDMFAHHEYYRYLNGGYKLPLVGGTDKMTGEVPVGIYRTYVYVPENEPFNYENWCKNLRLGRTFLSGGPLLHFTVEGAQIGDTLHLPKTGGTVEVAAEVESIFPVHRLEIVQEGRVVASVEETEGTQRLLLKGKIKVDHHSWLAARVGGPSYIHSLRHHDEAGRGIIAHSSPIYVAVGEEWWMSSSETAQYMLTLLHGGIEYIRTRSRQYPQGRVFHHHKEEDHLGYLERPFYEAIKRVEERVRLRGI